MLRLFIWMRDNPRRAFRRAFAITALTCAAIALYCTLADPVVRRTTVMMPGLPAGSPPITVLLMSDFHVANPDMPPARLSRIVEQVNALHPDIVLLAGDFVTDRALATRHYNTRDSLAPLAALKPRLGTYAVLGNHDHWRNAVDATVELRRIGITLLANSAQKVGPLTIGGLHSDSTFHSDVPALQRSLPADHGATLVLSHSPDVWPKVPLDIPLTLAGHTHCGQVRWPWGTSPSYMSNFGERYACGRVDEFGHSLVVTGGLGTSVLPFRFLVMPDMWLVTLTPPKANGAQTSARTPPD